MIELARTELGRITVGEGVLEGLVHDAASGVEGARVPRRRKHVRVQAEDGGAVAVEIGLSAEAGAVLPALGEAVQRQVAEALSAALDVQPARVDVSIDGVHAAGERT